MALWTLRDWTTGLRVTQAIMDTEFNAINNAFTQDVTYTPTLTASTTTPTVTYNLQEGRYTQIGQKVMGKINLKFNVVTSAGSGDYIFALPVDPRDPGSSFNARIGWAEVYDNSATTGFSTTVIRTGTSVCKLRRDGTSQFVTHAAPFAWATNDEICIFLDYQAA